MFEAFICQKHNERRQVVEIGRGKQMMRCQSCYEDDQAAIAAFFTNATTEGKPMKLEITKEECLRYAALEGDSEIGAGKLALDTVVNYPRITDHDNGEITATLDGEELRGWIYANDVERRQKMQMAHEFAEGWYQAKTYIKIAV